MMDMISTATITTVTLTMTTPTREALVTVSRASVEAFSERGRRLWRPRAHLAVATPKGPRGVKTRENGGGRESPGNVQVIVCRERGCNARSVPHKAARLTIQRRVMVLVRASTGHNRRFLIWNVVSPKIEKMWGMKKSVFRFRCTACSTCVCKFSLSYLRVQVQKPV